MPHDVDRVKLEHIGTRRRRFMLLGASGILAIYAASCVPSLRRQFLTRRMLHKYCKGRVLDGFSHLAGHDRIELLEQTRAPVVEVHLMAWAQASPLCPETGFSMKTMESLPKFDDLKFAVKHDPSMQNSCVTYAPFDEAAEVRVVPATKRKSFHCALALDGLSWLPPKDAVQAVTRMLGWLESDGSGHLVVSDYAFSRTSSLLGKAAWAFHTASGSSFHPFHDVDQLVAQAITTAQRVQQESGNIAPRFVVAESSSCSFGTYRIVVIQRSTAAP